MRVMVMVKATKSSEAGELPSEQLLTDMPFLPVSIVLVPV